MRAVRMTGARNIDTMPRLTPSQMEHLTWTGTWEEDGGYTLEQKAAMQAKRPTWSYFEEFEVKLGPADASGLMNPDDYTTVICPVIAWTKDRARLLIITPSGEEKWVHGDRS